MSITCALYRRHPMLKWPCAAMLALVFIAPPALGEASKIDPRVEEQINFGQGRQGVIILCQTQLLEREEGFAGFTNDHADADRLDLRTQTIAELKRIASDEQQAIRDALSSKIEWKPLWVVNAMAANLTVRQIRAAARLDAVRYIYSSNVLQHRRPSRSSYAVVRDVTQEPFDPAGKRVAWNVQEIGAPEVWSELAITGDGVVVGVLDSGVNLAHHDLRGRIWRNADEIPRNGIDDDANGYVDDIHGYDFGAMSPNISAQPNARNRQHGSMTAGIVAGDGSGGIITGVAPRARVMPLIVASGFYQAALAHQYALENGVDILSMSFSLPGLGQTRGLWRLMSEQCVCAGLVLVSGAGNFQQSADIPVQQRIPEGIPCVISVGGVDRQRAIATFSSMGPVEWAGVRFYEDHPMPGGLIKPDIAAFPGPGYAVIASADAGYIDPNTKIAGNSFSGPQGAGVAALMLSANPSLLAWRVKEMLQATAIDLGEPGKDNQTGAGLIDAPAAVRAAIDAGEANR